MTNQNIENDKIKFENLFKSFFADLPNTSICISNNKIVIQEVSDENSDPASVDLELKNEKYYCLFFGMATLLQKRMKPLIMMMLSLNIKNLQRN